VRKILLGTAALFLLFGGLNLAAAQEDFISVAGQPTGHESDHFEFHVTDDGNNTGREYGRFRYFEALATPTLDAPAGWVAGDRVGYRCGWAFLHYRQWIVGRVTYTVISNGPPEPLSTALNDKYMAEGQRRYDGTFDGSGQQFDADCTNPPSGDGTTTAGPSGFGVYPDLPLGFDFDPSVVVFYHGPHDIEVRDFADLADVTALPHSDLRLRIAAQSERRVTVVGYERTATAWAPRVEVHFDVMVPGGIVPGTDHPVELRTTLEPEPEPSPSPRPLTADFDGDGDVDLDDLAAFIAAFIEESQA
jgi:hypothetical protein